MTVRREIPKPHREPNRRSTEGTMFRGKTVGLISREGEEEADGTSELGLVPPIRIERTTNGLGM